MREAASEIDGLAKGANFTERASERFYRRHLTSYFAAALMMPYARFLRACEQGGYDILLLQRRFGAGFEQVAHRLTTLRDANTILVFDGGRIVECGKYDELLKADGAFAELARHAESNNG